MKYTEEIIKKVTELIEKGFFYKEIIVILNLNVKVGALKNKMLSLGISSKLITESKYPNRKKMRICLNCQKKFIVNIKSKPNKFCSKSCSSIFNNRNRGKMTNEDFIEKNKLSCREFYYKIINRHCLSCNDSFMGKYATKYCDNCEIFKLNNRLFNKLNINETFSLKEKGKIALNLLKYEYFDNKLSANEIYDKYNIYQTSFKEFFNKHGLSLRKLDISLINAVETGRKVKNVRNSLKYKQNWFITWENKKIFYRSSYELDYINYLQKNRISYDMELLRLKYFDTFKNKERIAIPDFYLSETNTIVEIKSRYRFNLQNMIDKYSKYKELGFNFKLIYEHIEYIEDEFINKLYQLSDTIVEII